MKKISKRMDLNKIKLSKQGLAKGGVKSPLKIEMDEVCVPLFSSPNGFTPPRLITVYVSFKNHRKIT